MDPAPRTMSLLAPIFIAPPPKLACCVPDTNTSLTLFPLYWFARRKWVGSNGMIPSMLAGIQIEVFGADYTAV